MPWESLTIFIQFLSIGANCDMSKLATEVFFGIHGFRIPFAFWCVFLVVHYRKVLGMTLFRVKSL